MGKLYYQKYKKFPLISFLQKHQKQQKLLFFVSFLLLWLFSGLRYNIGMDYPAYKELYENSLSKLNPDIKELGWAYLFYWFRNIECPFEFVILTISFFQFIMYFYLSKGIRHTHSCLSLFFSVLHNTIHTHLM